MTTQDLFDSTKELISSKIPNFKIKFKNESFWLKLLGFLMKPFSPSFTTRVITTFYPVIWFPSREWVRNNLTMAQKILCHEFVHLWDRQVDGPIWSFKYGIPQIFALIGLLALIAIPTQNPLWLLWLIPAALCVMPIISPAYWRMKAEMRGYSMTMALEIWRGTNPYDTPQKLDSISRIFTTPAYFWMWPFKKAVLRRLAKCVSDIKDGSIFENTKGEPFKLVYQLTKST